LNDRLITVVLNDYFYLVIKLALLENSSNESINNLPASSFKELSGNGTISKHL
jgi:hypothetical protein